MCTIIVSPTALEIARMKEATIPERAAGTTTFVATSNLVEPRAYAALRKDRGTETMASSLSVETIGMIINPITSPALKALKMIRSGKILCRIGVTNVSAK